MDRDRVSKLLQEISESLRIAEILTSLSLDEFLDDVRNRYALRMCIVEIVEAAVAIGLHILREHFHESVEGYVQVFKKLMERNVVSGDVGEGMIRFVKLRNLIVHRYWDVDDARMYREIREEGLRIVRRFIEEVESFVSRA